MMHDEKGSSVHFIILEICWQLSFIVSKIKQVPALSSAENNVFKALNVRPSSLARRSIQFLSWSSPSEDILKLNIDGAAWGNLG